MFVSQRRAYLAESVISNVLSDCAVIQCIIMIEINTHQFHYVYIEAENAFQLF